MPGTGFPVTRSILVYDADCGPCTGFKRLVSFLDLDSKISCLSLRDADNAGLLDSIPEDLRYLSMHFVATDKSVLSGSDAIPSILELLPCGRLPSRLLKLNGLGRKLTTIGYASAARLRGRSCRTRK